MDISISANFKKQARNSLLAVLLFILVYLGLLLGGVYLTIFCVKLGIGLIASAPHLITILIGIGIILLSVIILVFLIKFIFTSNKRDQSNLIEIKKEDQPELFKLIDEIVEKVDTSFPKKVFLSADVNASVFYNSSFWSMFLPVKKNLMIGMGLINTLKKEELKAILAHEFGHFSQDSMKIGSYVHNVNQIIFNMLFDNSSFDKFIMTIANISGIFSIIILIGVKVIQGIQYLLQFIYKIVNKQYLALSREMEFHADEIAAHVAGSEPSINSLLRLQLSDFSLNTVLEMYHKKIDENIKPNNVFSSQYHVMLAIAINDGIKIEDNLPKVLLEDLTKYNKSKLELSNQWESHPSTKDRIAKISEVNALIETIDKSRANSLLHSISELQGKLTKILFREVQYKKEVITESPEEFATYYDDIVESENLNEIYNGYYDNKTPLEFEPNEAINLKSSKSIEELFSDEWVNKTYDYFVLQNDLQTVELIVDKKSDITTFDYDGVKYSRRKSVEAKKIIKAELKNITEELTENDKEIFSHFYHKEKLPVSTLSFKYEELFKLSRTFDTNFKSYTSIMEGLSILQYNANIEEIQVRFDDIKMFESKIKIHLTSLLGLSYLKKDISEGMLTNFEKYLLKDWKYFGSQSYYEENLIMMQKAINDYAFLLGRQIFYIKKDLLDYQLTL